MFQFVYDAKYLKNHSKIIEFIVFIQRFLNIISVKLFLNEVDCPFWLQNESKSNSKTIFSYFLCINWPQNAFNLLLESQMKKINPRNKHWDVYLRKLLPMWHFHSLCIDLGPPRPKMMCNIIVWVVFSIYLHVQELIYALTIRCNKIITQTIEIYVFYWIKVIIYK